MATVRVLVVRAAGINCDEEMMHCWRLVGADPQLMHIDDLTTSPNRIEGFQIVTVPGGFSYGDDIAAGAILAQQFRLSLTDALRAHVERGGGILGVCNGFQALVKAGLLPGDAAMPARVTVSFNDSARFEARWVKLQVATDRCPFLEPGAILEMPIEHAEGRVVASDPDAQALIAGGFAAVRYIDDAGSHDTYPANPNGSTLGIAGLCDDTGRIFGLMPHPDRNFDPAHHPEWSRFPEVRTPDGRTVFERAVAHWR